MREAGGSISCVYRTKLKMRELLKPEKFRFPLEDPIPTTRVVKRMERARERGLIIFSFCNYKHALKILKAQKFLIMSHNG